MNGTDSITQVQPLRAGFFSGTKARLTALFIRISTIIIFHI